jgi:hypothetical protein
VLISVTALAQKQDGEPAARWWSYMQVLASDRLEGRRTGTPGHRKAVEYAAAQFKSAGLKPLGTDGYFQPIEFVSRTIDETRSELDLVRNGKVEKLDFARDAFIVPTPDLAERLEAPLVFAGYGLTLLESGIEDLKDLDVKGKVILYFMGAPASVQGPLSAHAQSVRERWKAFQAAGAVGWVRILNPESMDLPWARWAILQGVPSLAIGVGFQPGTSEEETLKKWLAERYHAPSDDLQQPIDRRTVEGFNRAFMALAIRVADRETRPQWSESSFFRRFAKDKHAEPAKRWWSHMEVLASDSLEGRLTGTPGHRKAAEYAAEQLKKVGLKPAGTHGYFQPVDFVSRKIDEANSKLELMRNDKAVQLDFAEDGYLLPAPDLAASLQAPLVFVGYGLTIPENSIEDLKGIDLKGKVAVFLSGAPTSVLGPLSAHAQSAREQWKSFKDAGALGWVRILDPNNMDIPWPRLSNSHNQPAMTFADASLNDTNGLRLSVTVNPAQAEKWFAGSPHSFAEIIELAKDNKPLPRFELPSKIRVAAKQQSQNVTSDNIAGLMPGSDPKLKDEYVVVTAHIDHLGVGNPINGDSIYNGAMDNAAGTAAVLDAAARLAESADKPRRSVIFLLVTAEEKGLLGSKYFANRPTVPASAIVANVNVDNPLPLYPLRSVIVLGLNESNLGEDVRAIGSQLGLEILPDPQPKRNTFIRSDQYSFIREGIPALAVKVGFKSGTPEEATQKKWLTERYHAPSDDLLQPINRQTAEEFDRAFAALVLRVANRDTRPSWNEQSFFRRFAKLRS